jgi:hypothetical protein
MVKKIKVKDLIEKYIDIHNEASEEFKKVFKEVGAKMWSSDKAHKWKMNSDFYQYHKNNMKKDLKSYGRKGYINPIRKPLTVLDSYPNVSTKQRKQLNQKVNDIVEKYRKKWFDFLKF